jgi:hypothetical protein
MSSRNYLINEEDLPLSEKKAYKVAALAAGLERCGTVGIGNIEADVPDLERIPSQDKDSRVEAIGRYIKPGAWPKSIDQRELVTGPLRSDFVVATALDEMITAALAVVGTPYSCFQAVAAPQLIINRLVVFYGISINAAPNPVSYLLFRTGGAAGNVVAMFDLQGQDTRLQYDCFFSEPVVFDPQEVFAVQVVCKIIAAATRVHLHNFLFGPAGQTIL